MNCELCSLHFSLYYIHTLWTMTPILLQCCFWLQSFVAKGSGALLQKRRPFFWSRLASFRMRIRCRPFCSCCCWRWCWCWCWCCCFCNNAFPLLLFVFHECVLFSCGLGRTQIFECASSPAKFWPFYICPVPKLIFVLKVLKSNWDGQDGHRNGQRKTHTVDVGLSPLPVTVTTRIITFLVGDSYKPSFATRRGDNPK